MLLRTKANQNYAFKVKANHRAINHVVEINQRRAQDTAGINQRRAQDINKSPSIASINHQSIHKYTTRLLHNHN